MTQYSADEVDELREHYLGELDKKDAEIERLQAQIKIELERSVQVEVSYRFRTQQDEAEIERLRARNAELLVALKALVEHADATVLTGWRDRDIFKNAYAAIGNAET